MSPRVPWLFAVVFAVTSLAAGCRKGAPPQNQTPPPLGDGSPTSLNAAANDPSFYSPFDATPSPDGTTIYFAALQGNDASILSVPASGGPATVLATGAPLTAPFGIAIDTAGKNLFIADANGTSNPDDDTGSILVLSTTGGTPQPLTGTVGYSPRGIVIVAGANGDTAYFTGVDPVSGKPGAFSIPSAGGSATVLAEGAPFVDPSGIAVTAQGVAYVADAVATASGDASVIEISGNTATILVPDILVGYPAGVALSQDEQVLLVSGINPDTRTDEVIRVVLASQATTTISKGIDGFFESAGLHRSPGAEVYAWADSSANSTGTVYVLK